MTKESYMKEVYDTKTYAEDLTIIIRDGSGNTTKYQDVKKAYLESLGKLKIKTHSGNEETINIRKGHVINGVNPEDHNIQFIDSSCFLTSACVNAKNLPDDCEELTVLRNYRDNYLLKNNQGHLEVNHYYRIAPQIIEEICALPNAKQIFIDMYTTLVKPSVKLIKQNRLEVAYNLYKEKTLELEKLYLNKIPVESK